MSWEKAFLIQAQSDWQVYKILNEVGPKLPECHRLHYLLMSGEKLAKYHLSSDSEPSKPSHFVLDSFIQSCKSNKRLREYLGYKDSGEKYSEFIQSMKQIASNLVKLAPTSRNSDMNVEYPWEISSGEVKIPCQVNFLNALNIRPSAYNAFISFIEKVIVFLKT
jgi:hypothetical protein